ncbi:protein phosphatase 2C domain-containing protein [Oscillatoria sp. CS-180]|uniref:PP2C family protein-serine/threonine phosphatase n=1 Tax=Oscillatoria sp. CS-180 TaxID=3021720 RepID=UPI00232C3C5B|nr:protein phosphatase 2C domain-containing protein [Oscillatoria sp. CS-180]MDB9527681.1 protein phosphatase 2C domain-containing protein [Oscillatoria sp. CS-180]
MLKLIFSGMTDPGLLRSSNQDAYFIDPQGRFFIVADGMGGHAGGQEASSIATRTIRSFIEQNWESSLETSDLLCQALRLANKAILSDQKSHPERGDMGTTVVVLVFREQNDSEPWCAHVGDSRLYRLRESDISQITEDHTWIARAVREGELTIEQSRSHPWRHVLSQCLGREDLSRIDVRPIEAKPGDRFLLCTDGLTEELPDGIIATHLKSIRAVESAAQALVDSAKKQGGRDNITVVLVTLLMDEESQKEGESETGFIKP